MLDGKPAVFLSCMTSVADRLVRPICDRLNAAGYRAVIVADEPKRKGAFTIEDKVGGYLNAADAFVALATADDRLGGAATAQNIIDEIRWARALPNLRDVVLIMKEDSVTLPSNIAPVCEPLDRDQPDAAVGIIMRQLAAWGVVPALSPTPTPVEPLPEEYLADLFGGTGLGEHDATEARLRTLFGMSSKQDQHRIAHDIFEHLLTLPGDGNEIHIVSGFLEACARIDAALIEPSWVEQLVESSVVQHRMCAAVMLWDRSVVDPAMYPSTTSQSSPSRQRKTGTSTPRR